MYTTYDINYMNLALFNALVCGKNTQKSNPLHRLEGIKKAFGFKLFDVLKFRFGLTSVIMSTFHSYYI
jgi:hypothetical protein